MRWSVSVFGETNEKPLSSMDNKEKNRETFMPRAEFELLTPVCKCNGCYWFQQLDNYRPKVNHTTYKNYYLHSYK
jgi:hypothetical protein